MVERISRGLEVLRRSGTGSDPSYGERLVGYDPLVLLVDADNSVRRRAWDALKSTPKEEGFQRRIAGFVQSLEPEEIRLLLTDPDPAIRRHLWDVLDGYDDESDTDRLGAVLRVLADDRFDYARSDCEQIIRRACLRVFEDVVEVLADDPPPGLAGRLRRAFGISAQERPLALSPRAADSMIHCWRWSCGRHGGFVAAHRCRHLPVLVALSASSCADIRRSAVESLVEFGPGVVEVLREVRRSRSPSRSMALAVIAELGWHNLDPVDLMALYRLIRIKQRTETPSPVSQEDFHASWYALPTTDRAAVLAAFDLHDPIPVTMRMGFAPWQGHMPEYVDADLHELDGPYRYRWLPYSQVFVTPALDGWTLVVWQEFSGESFDGRMYRRLERLSRQFGAAHFYSQMDDGSLGLGSEWCVAESGTVRVHCGCYDGEVHVHRSTELDPTVPADEAVREWLAANDHGEGHRPPEPEPINIDLLSGKNRLRARFGQDSLSLAEEDYQYSKEAMREWECGVQGASWRLSVSLETLGAHTRVQGSGVLAVPAGRRDVVRRGRLPI